MFCRPVRQSVTFQGDRQDAALRVQRDIHAHRLNRLHGVFCLEQQRLARGKGWRWRGGWRGGGEAVLVAVGVWVKVGVNVLVGVGLVVGVAVRVGVRVEVELRKGTVIDGSRVDVGLNGVGLAAQTNMPGREHQQYEEKGEYLQGVMSALHSRNKFTVMG